MKVKVIENNRTDYFEEEITDFIKNKKIIDIKYQSNVCVNTYLNFLFTALIMYEDKTNEMETN